MLPSCISDKWITNEAPFIIPEEDGSSEHVRSQVTTKPSLFHKYNKNNSTHVPTAALSNTLHSKLVDDLNGSNTSSADYITHPSNTSEHLLDIVEHDIQPVVSEIKNTSFVWTEGNDTILQDDALTLTESPSPSNQTTGSTVIGLNNSDSETRGIEEAHNGGTTTKFPANQSKKPNNIDNEKVVKISGQKIGIESDVVGLNTPEALEESSASSAPNMRVPLNDQKGVLGILADPHLQDPHMERTLLGGIAINKTNQYFDIETQIHPEQTTEGIAKYEEAPTTVMEQSPFNESLDLPGNILIKIY